MFIGIYVTVWSILGVLGVAAVIVDHRRRCEALGLSFPPRFYFVPQLHFVPSV